MNMKFYKVEVKPLAEKDLRVINKADALRILKKIISLENGITGDIKKLTDFTPEYRLRVGNYRILFEIENDTINIYRVIHRKESYRGG
jgi:mRNA interferase RelE/StbE